MTTSDRRAGGQLGEFIDREYVVLDQDLKHGCKEQSQKLRMLLRMAHTANSKPICERRLTDSYAKLMGAIQGERMPERSYDRRK